MWDAVWAFSFCMMQTQRVINYESERTPARAVGAALNQTAARLQPQQGRRPREESSTRRFESTKGKGWWKLEALPESCPPPWWRKWSGRVQQEGRLYPSVVRYQQPGDALEGTRPSRTPSPVWFFLFFFFFKVRYYQKIPVISPFLLINTKTNAVIINH